jgi:MFS family permease
LSSTVTVHRPVADERPRPDNLWRNGEFLRLWAGQTVSSVGTGIVKLAAPLLVLALTESPAMAGIVAGATMFPMVFIGLPAGALIDRWDRRKILLVCDSFRALAVASVPVAWFLGTLNAWHLLAVATALGIGQSFQNVAQTASLPRVVQRRQIPLAHSLNTTSEGVAQLTSPGLGGMIVAAGSTVVAGGVMAYSVNALTFLVSVLALASIATPLQGRRGDGPRMNIWGSIGEGLRYVWRETAIRLLMIQNMVHRLFFAPVMLTVVVLAREDLGLDPARIGLLFSAAGAGGLTAAAVTPWLRRRVPLGWHMVGITAIHSVALGIVAVAPSAWPLVVALCFAGMMETMTGITQVSFRLALIPDAFQGRVNSVYRTLSFTAMGIGPAVAGVLIDIHGPRAVMTLISVGIGATALGTLLSGIRTLRDA